MKIKIALFACLFLVSFFSIAQKLSTDIRMNQLGFLPNSVKLAAVVNAKPIVSQVRTATCRIWY
jgi:Skp family chaperone for outer membrane proteins